MEQELKENREFFELLGVTQKSKKEEPLSVKLAREILNR